MDSDRQILPIAVLLDLAQRRWLLLLCVVSAFASAGVAIGRLSTPLYRATVTLSPQGSGEQASGLASLLDEVSGLSGIASLGDGSGDPGDDSLAILRSRAFFEAFAQQRNAIPVLFEGDWDEETGTWHASVAPEDVPTVSDAWEFFDTQVRGIAQDQQTSIVTISITLSDRVLAAEWANALANLINETQRARAMADAGDRIQLLRAQLEKTSVVELQQAIYRLMEVEIRKEVLAQSRKDYAFTVVDPASVPDVDRFVSPKRLLLIAVFLLIGVVAAVIVVVVDESRRYLAKARR